MANTATEKEFGGGEMVSSFRVAYLVAGISMLVTGCVTKQQSGQSSKSGATQVSGASTKNRWLFAEAWPKYSRISSEYSGAKPVLSDGTTLPRSAELPKITADGKWVYFLSNEKLTTETTNGKSQLYRIATPTIVGGSYGSIELVSKRPATSVSTSCGSLSVPAGPADGFVLDYAVSYDGSKVALVATSAEDLVPNAFCDEKTKTPTLQKLGANLLIGSSQVYFLNVSTKEFQLVSRFDTASAAKSIGSVEDHWGNVAISGNGRFLAYESSDPDQISPDKKTGERIYDEFNNKGIMLYDTQKEITTLASFPGTTNSAFSADLGKLNGDSYEPALNGDGSVLVFTSRSRLLPEDQTSDVKDNKGVADVYRAVFNVSGSDVDITNRVKLELVSVDVGSSVSTGSRGSSNPSITADGQIVAFQSTKSPVAMADYKPNGTFIEKDDFSTYVYARNVTTRKTGIINVSATQNGSSYTFGWAPFTAASNPVISSDGKYVAYEAINSTGLYQTKAMDEWGKPKIVMPSGRSDSCANMSKLSVFDEHEYYDWTKKWFDLEKIGWKDVVSSECLPGLYPDAFGSTQIYLVKLDPSTKASPEKMIPVSVGAPVHLFNWTTSFLKPSFVSLDGYFDGTHDSGPHGPSGYAVIKFMKVYTAFYGDSDSYSASIANDAKGLVFQSDSSSLLGDTNKESSFDSYKVFDSYYNSAIPQPNIFWFNKYSTEELAKFYNYYDSSSPFYWQNDVGYDTIWSYTASNPINFELEGDSAR